MNHPVHAVHCKVVGCNAER